MDKIKLSKAFSMTSPNPVTLVCTGKPDGKTNLATVSWWMYLSIKPQLLCFAMAKTSYSGELIRQNNKVVLAMPSSEITDAAFKCGTSTGRKVDKPGEYGIELMELPDCSVKIPTHTRLAFDCTLINTVDAGDHFLYVCDINEIYGDESREQIFAWNGYAKLNPLP